MCNPVADPDPEIRGGAGLQKCFFQPFDPPFGLKIRGGPRPTRPLPLIRHCIHSIGDVFICKVKITCFKRDLESRLLRTRYASCTT